MSNNFKVLFVYGTLKNNCHSNNLLAKSKFLGKAFTTEDYELYACFTYPALIHAPKKGHSIEGEVYEVDLETMRILDVYEGVEYGLYNCEKIKILSTEMTENLCDSKNVYSYFYYGNMKNFRKIEKWTCT